MPTNGLVWSLDEAMGRREERPDSSGDAGFVAGEKMTLRAALPTANALRVWADVQLGGGAEPITLSLGDAVGAVTMRGDRDDPMLIRASAGRRERNARQEGVEYRLRPDFSRWATDEMAQEQWEWEFAGVPGWRETTVRLALDATKHEVRAWIDGQFVAAWEPRTSAPARAALVLHAGDRLISSGVLPLPERDEFLPLDLTPHYNDRCGYAKGVSAGRETITSDGVPFFASESAAEKDNIDLGLTKYRGITAYVHTSSLSSDPARALLRVPKRMYDLAHLLCSVDDDRGSVPVGALRFVVPEQARVVTSEFAIDVRKAVALPGTHLFHVTVPLSPGAFQESLTDEAADALEVDLTRRVSQDENRFPRPAGPPSALHIHAVTFERAPVAVSVTSDHVGHIFEEPDVPRFSVHLENDRAVRQQVNVVAEVSDPYGGRASCAQKVALEGGEKREVTFDLPQSSYGRFGLTVRVSAPDGSRPLTRSTTFATLPPDTRKATADSPFGMWCFLDGHFGAPAETAGRLFRLAGVKSILANFVVNADRALTRERIATLAKYGVRVSCGNVACIHITCNDGCADVDEMLRKMHEMPPVDYWLVFWETSLSREHARDLQPDLFGGAPRPLTEQEKLALANCRNTAVEYAGRVREEFPGAKLVYGNGFPNFIGELLRDDFPPDLIDGFGLDFDLFLSMPELQPGVHYAPFAGLYHLKQFQDMYGYGDKPRYLTEAIYSPQAEGWLTEREQADYYVRAHLLGLASGVVHFGMTAEMWDPGGEYHYSHYGPVGLCHRPPELNPRESFCAYATMTRMIDRAGFEEMLPTPSPSVFALKFRRSCGGPIHVFWTIRGEREVMLSGDAAGPVRATDLFGNTRPVETADGKGTVTITSSPLYVEGYERITDLRLGAPRHRGKPRRETPFIVLDALDAWEPVAGDDAWMESLTDWPTPCVRAPYKRGRFAVSIVRDAERGPALRVELNGEQPGHALTVWYHVMRRARPVTLPAGRAIGAWIRGNSSWGRVLFELRDGDGTRWRSVLDDNYIDFDGWRYVETELPRPYDEERVDPRGYSSWKSDGENAVPVGPLTLTALIFEGRSHLIRAAGADPVAEAAFDVARLVVTGEK